jgi:hypothetical protein
MKRYASILLSLLLVLLLPGCRQDRPTAPTTTAASIQLADFGADQIVLSSTLSSFLLVSEDQQLVDELADSCRSARFAATDQAMDIGSARQLTLLFAGQILEKISIDRQGVCRIEGQPGCYQVSGGTLTYERLTQIFTQAQQAAMTGSP